MGNLTTRGLHHLDGSDLSQGFHHGKSKTLVIRNPDSAIPDFPKWVILRHVASVIRTAHIYPGVFTMENPELSSLGILNSVIPDFLKWVILRHVASVNQTTPIYPRFFAPIHWGLNPRVTPDRSNGYRVFQPRSDGSDWFLPMHSSTTPWT
jgi:hypothetical protein